jgi:hypothetical protein
MRLTVGLAMLLLSVAACSIGVVANSPYMRPSSMVDADLRPVPPGKARVVFLRGADARGGTYLILDEAGHFVGETSPNTRFSVDVAPGSHHFIGWGSGYTESLYATLSGGRTYWIIISHHPALWAVTRKSGLQKDVASLRRTTKEMIPNTSAGQAQLDSLGTAAQDAAQTGIETYEAYEGDARAEATLGPNDYFQYQDLP